jgi:3-oxoacyl-[acyl-carrier protein] reductase
MAALLKNKVAIVSGASGGIGSAVAELFASEGVNVVVHYSSSKDKAEALAANLSKKYKTSCIALGADAANKMNVTDLVSEVFKKFHKIDILANFIGFPVNEKTKDYWFSSFENSPWRHYQDVIDVDLRGTINFCQSVLPYMKKQKSGKIINVSSTPAISGHMQGHPYTAAKAAIIGLTKDLAIEFGRYNIKINAIAPGNIETVWSKTLSRKQHRAAAQEAPLKRWGQPIDIAKVALFLASELSDFVTGQTIIVDGGTVMR